MNVQHQNHSLNRVNSSSSITFIKFPPQKPLTLVMAHLVGIDKGPVMDWTNDAGLDECYRKWKKCLEVLFKGLLSELTDAVKCNYIIYWSGDHGMDLVDKWISEKVHQ